MLTGFASFNLWSKQNESCKCNLSLRYFGWVILKVVFLKDTNKKYFHALDLVVSVLPQSVDTNVLKILLSNYNGAFFCKYDQRRLVVNYFHQGAPS